MGTIMEAKRIDKWLRRTISYQVESYGPIFKISLRHVSAGQKVGSEIHQFQVSPQMTGYDIEALATNIETYATDDASGMQDGSTQRYVLLPFFENDKDKPHGRLVFAVGGDSFGEDGNELVSEAPNQRGLTSQLMRHNEAMAKMLVLGMQSVMQSQQRTIVQQSQQLEHVSDKHFEAVALIEEMSSNKHERDLEAKRLDLKQQMQIETFQNVKMLVPAVVNRLSGKKVMKEPVTPQQMLLKKFMDSIKPDQFQKWLNEMNTEQRIAIMELYQSMYDVGENGEEVPTPPNGESNGDTSSS
jgi:hypothetical protein